MINPKTIRELWERVNFEVLLSFPGASRAVRLWKSFLLFRRRFPLLVGGESGWG